MKNCYVKPGIPCSFQHDTTVKKRFDFILTNLNINKNNMVLDIGAGFGIYTSALSINAKTGIGIDIYKENLNKAKEINKPDNVTFIPMSAENLAFQNDSFDIVIMIEVLEHVINDERAINEIYRVLKPGGKLIITAPNKLFPFETHGFRLGSKSFATKGLGFPLLPYLPEALRNYTANARVYTSWSLKKKMISAGFTINNIKFLSPGLDQLRINFPKLDKMIINIQKIVDKLEKVKIVNFLISPTIIVCADKVKNE